MHFNEDNRIKLPIPFLQDKTVLYVDSRTGTSHFYIEANRHVIASEFEAVGYTFLFLPELAGNLFPEVLHYMLPGQDDILLAEDMYQRIQDLANLGDKTGFLYKQDGQTYFRVLPELSDKDIETAVQSFIAYLHQEEFPKTGGTRFREKSSGGTRFRKKIESKDSEDVLFRVEMDFDMDGGIGLAEPEAIPETKESGIRFSIRSREENLDPRTQSIIDEWESLSKRFGITIEDLQVILGYKVNLSRLYITTSNRIYLADIKDRPEVKLDDLTKALYFFYLKHPEGAAFKDLSNYEDEVLHIYMGITGRDDLVGIRKSVSSLVSPYSDGRNSCVSRIKKAFKDIVGDHIAKYYYIDGKYAETRSVSIDRDLVIWEH
jgi:hypothetical protein